jgi:hypothetical protein
MGRDQLEAWVLRLCAEAHAVDEVAATEVICALTGGYEEFCPGPYSREVLHRVAAAFLRIARL